MTGPKLEWTKSEGGCCETRCGRFKITPEYFGRVKAQSFAVHDTKTNARSTWDTQKRCKEWADYQVERTTWPRVYETYIEPSWTIHLDSPGPSCCNGHVQVVRYRVTVEPIDEPEAIRERILKLWRECDNSHHWAPLKSAARQYGVELDETECGRDRKKEK